MFEFLMNFRKSGSVLNLSTAEIKEGVSGVLFVDWIQIVDLAVLFLEFFLQLLCIYGELFHLLIFLVHELCLQWSKGLQLNTVMAKEHVSLVFSLHTCIFFVMEQPEQSNPQMCDENVSMFI